MQSGDYTVSGKKTVEQAKQICSQNNDCTGFHRTMDGPHKGVCWFNTVYVKGNGEFSDIIECYVKNKLSMAEIKVFSSQVSISPSAILNRQSGLDFCRKMNTFELEVKDIKSSTFVPWVSNTVSTPYIFNPDTGEIIIDLSKGTINQMLKISVSIGGATKVETNQFKVLQKCPLPTPKAPQTVTPSNILLDLTASTSSAPPYNLIGIPTGKTDIDKFVSQTNPLCKISKYIMYVKENSSGTFKKFLKTSNVTPYIFDEVTGNLEVDLSLGIIDHTLKLSVETADGMIADDITTYTVKYKCAPITITTVSADKFTKIHDNAFCKGGAGAKCTE